MNYEERIKKFGQENAPFDLVDHENGRFSLCLTFFRKNTRTMGRKPLTLMRGRLESR